MESTKISANLSESQSANRVVSGGLEVSWQEHLGEEFSKPYMLELKEFLKQQDANKKIIYPQKDKYFSAFASAPFAKCKVVILGQDPYHGPGQAHGLCFSVQRGTALPPSLQNIYKELQSDLGISKPNHGCLESWGWQGVLLLNSVLTVEDGKAGSHQNKGWEKFTDRVIQVLNEKRENLVFILWGAYAQKKAAFVDRKRHLVIESVHPSPLSAHRGFFGTKPFSKSNAYLESHQIKPIDWSVL